MLPGGGLSPDASNRTTAVGREFLEATEIVDWDRTEVHSLALDLAAGSNDPFTIAGRCFAWVRDEIQHSADHQLNPVTCAASEVLRHRTGFCYAKSHLLAALLRANGIPAGFCYQRLVLDDDRPEFCLHGLNAVSLPGLRWYRVDARGDRPGLATTFSPPEERLAFAPRLTGESTFAGVWAAPLPIVVATLRNHRTVAELLGHLPDEVSPGPDPERIPLVPVCGRS